MNSDFLIIGGGIAGVSAAAELSALGSVVLLEAESALAHHASGRSAALYEPRYGAPAVVELSMASGPRFFAMDGVLSPRGMMLVAAAEDAAMFAADAAAMTIDPISPTEAIAIVPILDPAVLAYAAIADHAHDIDTDRLIQGYARTARDNGARILTGARVTGLARNGAGWRAIWEGGAAQATVVVNASGPWADTTAALAGVAPLGLTPHRRSMARIPAPPGHDPKAWPMVMGAGETWYMKPDAGALIVSPAEEHAMKPHDAYADDMVLAEGLARYEAMVTTPVTRLLANWAGLRTFAPDRVPVIGFADAPGFFWLAGQGGYGFQTAPAAARLAADLIGGRAPEVSPGLVAVLAPGRFR